jgi:hypothetical protein
VFTRSGATWTQQGAKLTGTGETGAGFFGYSVALSADGNTALIGGPTDNSDVGAAWAFGSDTDLALTGVPASITTDATGSSGAVVTYASPTAVDEGGETPTVGCDPASGSTFAIGTTTVTCTASDSDDANSPVQATFTVTVRDTDLALTGVPANITTDATSSSGATVTYTSPTAVDEGGETPTVGCSPGSGSTFAIGTTTVTCTASDSDDANGPVQATFTVTVRDTDLALTGVPANITTDATSSSGATVTYASPTAVDEGSETPSVGCSPVSGSTFAIGSTTVACTATDPDDANSPVQATFTVTVRKAPTALSAAPQLVLLPPGGIGVGNVSATLTSFGQPLAGRTITFSSGATQLCSAVTGAGGTASCNVGLLGELAVLLSNSYTATFAGDSAFLGSTAQTPAIVLLGSAQIASAHGPRVAITRGELAGHGVRVVILRHHAHVRAALRGLGRVRAGRYTLTVTLTNGRVLSRTVLLR